MRTRTAGVVLAWLLAAGAATVVGAVAVGAIGEGIVPPAEQPLSQDEVSRLLAQPPATTSSSSPPSTSSRPSSKPPSSGAGARKVFTNRGGSVVARCTGGVVEVVSTTPAQGFRLDDIEAEDGGQRVRFESGDSSGDDNEVKVSVQLSCRGDEPRAAVEVDDD